MPPRRRQRVESPTNDELDEDLVHRRRQPLMDLVEPNQLDRRRFPNLNQQRRFYELNRSRACVKERGICAEHLNDDRIQPLLQWLGWENFARHMTTQVTGRKHE